MSDHDPLAGSQDAGSQPDAAPGGVPNAGTPTGNQNDKGKSPDLSKYVPVDDLRKMQSTYDKRIAEQEKRYAQMEAQFRELVAWREKNETEGLTPDELTAYNLEKAQYEANQKSQEAAQKMAELEYERNKLALRSYYVSQGAPDSIFTSDDPSEWQDNLIRYFKDRAEKAEAQAKKAQGTTPTPPTVTTNKPAAGAPGKIKMNTIPLGSKEEAQIYRDLDAGRIKVEDIDFS